MAMRVTEWDESYDGGFIAEILSDGAIYNVHHSKTTGWTIMDSQFVICYPYNGAALVELATQHEAEHFS